MYSPNGKNAEQTGRGVEFHSQLFDPNVDVEKYKPDLIIIRHVLEHMTNPAEFIEQLAFAVGSIKKVCYLFAEVPCIDVALDKKRITDFFYEHFSHFTTNSFKALMNKAGTVKALSHGYHREVIYGITALELNKTEFDLKNKTEEFHQEVNKNIQTIRAQIDELYNSDVSVAIWGGTGKCAAFINQYLVDAKLY